MALLGYAAGGRLGNFGDVGVDQTTFGPAVFLWFAGIGALTVAMSGAVVRPPRQTRAEPETEADRAPSDEAETRAGPGADADAGPRPRSRRAGDEHRETAD